jgi:hypothetical protein
MIAALTTIIFLATLWMLAMIALTMLDESGSKVLAAIKGRSPLAVAPVVQPVSWKASSRVRTVRPMRARPTLRAAA